MAAAEIFETTWTIPAMRFKTKVENVVPLSRATLQLIGSGRKKFIFSTNGGWRAFSGFSKSKAELDRKISELRARDGRKAMPRWVLHDLRRTARSLMSRAGVPSDIAERVLGIGGSAPRPVASPSHQGSNDDLPPFSWTGFCWKIPV